MPKRFMETLHEFYDEENHPNDDNKWTWEPILFFVVLVIIIALIVTFYMK